MNILARTGHFVASALMFLAAFRVFRGEWLVGDGAMIYIVSGLFLALGIHHLSMSQRQGTQLARSLPPGPVAGQDYSYPPPPLEGQYGYPPPPPRWPGGPGA
jgi:hypothetical protein